MEQGIIDGVRLFNSQRYFEAHEALEAVWLTATGGRRTLLQGLIQVAAAFHHQARGNRAGARSLLRKGRSKLEAFGAEFEGIDLSAFKRELRLWQKHLDASSPPSPQPSTPPQIRCYTGA
ncbi:MAG TPA: DUF309 domain-containing protein [Terriglobia bacterium]|nr:DUF309 domain-containing protein [Terriglobia bacterium]